MYQTNCNKLVHLITKVKTIKTKSHMQRTVYEHWFPLEDRLEHLHTRNEHHAQLESVRELYPSHL